MTQNTNVIGSGLTGLQYRTADNNAMAAIVSSHKGGSEPAYKVAGMIWLDDSGGATSWVIKLYDGADWITIGVFNTTTNVYTPAGAALVNGSRNYAADAGSTDAYAITNTSIGTLTVGQVIQFKANTINTGTCSLNVNAGGAITIKKQATLDLDNGDIKAGQIVSVVYDGTYWQLIGGTGSSTAGSLYAADTGSVNAFAIALTPALTSYVEGPIYLFKAANANTGSASLNINGLGARTIYKNFNEPLLSGDIKAGQMVAVTYYAGATRFQLISTPSAPSSLVNINTSQYFLTGNYTAVFADKSGFLVCSSSSAFTLSLSAASVLGDGWYIFVANEGSANVTIDPNSTEQIDGATSIILAPGESCIIVNMGSSFRTIGRRKSFESPPLTITSGSNTNVGHPFQKRPTKVWGVLKCVTGEHGFSTNDEVDVGDYVTSTNSANNGCVFRVDTSSITVRFGSATNVFNVLDASGNRQNVTNANWNFIIRAEL